MGIVDQLADRFRNRISPGLFRSKRFWSAARGLLRSPLSRPDRESDRVATLFAVESTGDAYLSRGPVVWANLLFPSEIIHAAGAVPFYPEVAAAVIASAGFTERFTEEAGRAGFSRDLCSFHLVSIGAALQGFLPEPDLLVSTAHPCDSAPLSFSLLAERFDADHVQLEMPVDGTKRGMGLLASRLEEVAHSIRDLCGLSCGSMTSGLEKAIELSNEARGYMLEAQELRKARPCPLDGWDAIGHLSLVAMAPGSEACVDFYRLLKEELENPDPSTGLEDQRHRLLWMHLKPFFPNDIGEFLRERGAVIVCEEYNRCYWDRLDPAGPYLSLARKAAGHHIAGPASRRSAAMARLADEYGVDGAVHFSHRGCRQSGGCAAQVRDVLSEKGVRTLILDGECLDPREYTEGQLKTRLEAFLETL